MTSELFTAAFKQSRTEERLANLFELTQLFNAEFFEKPIIQDQLNQNGSVWRVLSTSVLHKTFYQPFVHPIPVPADPASPFYTPMTVQRCACWRHALGRGAGKGRQAPDHHQGHVVKPPQKGEGDGDMWWTAGTACGGTGHLGLTHTETQRGRAMDGLWTEVYGQQKQSNDPGNNQHILNTPIIGRR